MTDVCVRCLLQGDRRPVDPTSGEFTGHCSDHGLLSESEVVTPPITSGDWPWWVDSPPLSAFDARQGGAVDG